MTWNMTHSEESEGLFSKDQEETPDSPEVLLPVGLRTVWSPPQRRLDPGAVRVEDP